MYMYFKIILICTAFVAEGNPEEPAAEPKGDPAAEPEGKTGAASEAEPGASPTGEKAAFAELQKFTVEEQTEAQKVLCALKGGDVDRPKPPPSRFHFEKFILVEIALDYQTYNLSCWNPPEEEEDCTSKGGKWGEWCLEEGKCTLDMGCHFTVPKELLTPTGEKFLQKRFEWKKEMEKWRNTPAESGVAGAEVGEPEVAEEPTAEPAPARRQRRRMRRMRRMRRRM